VISIEVYVMKLVVRKLWYADKPRMTFFSLFTAQLPDGMADEDSSADTQQCN
jgi:hypothetical protein